jgi:ribonuclease HI
MFRLSQHATPLNTVLRGELAAIHVALRDIPATEGITLLTNSQTSIHLIQAMLTKPQSLLRHKHRWLLSELVQTLYSRLAPTAIHKVRGHIGSFGNTVADELANTAHTDPAALPFVSAPSPGRGVFWPQYFAPAASSAGAPNLRDVDDLRVHPRTLASSAHSSALLTSSSTTTVQRIRALVTDSPATM